MITIGRALEALESNDRGLIRQVFVALVAPPGGPHIEPAPARRLLKIFRNVCAALEDDDTVMPIGIVRLWAMTPGATYADGASEARGRMSAIGEQFANQEKRRAAGLRRAS